MSSVGFRATLSGFRRDVTSKTFPVYMIWVVTFMIANCDAAVAMSFSDVAKNRDGAAQRLFPCINVMRTSDGNILSPTYHHQPFHSHRLPWSCKLRLKGGDANLPENKEINISAETGSDPLSDGREVAPSQQLKASVPPAPNWSAPNEPQNATVNAFEVKGVVDYDRLIETFGSERITPSLIERMERLTGRRAHHLLRRGFFFSHRDLGAILDLYEAGQPFYLYTGRGPSSAGMHIGHMVPFLFTRWLQEAFRVPVVIQLTDDEKYLWKGGDLPTYQRYARDNARDIIAVGFDANLTYIFSDTDAIGQLYPVVLAIQRHVTYSQVKGIFGFDDGDNIGKHAFPAVQAAPSFSSALPLVFPLQKELACLIPCAIDQDPYFRMTRDVAPRLHRRKPALLHSKFIPALQGSTGKMSASLADTAIYLSDSAAEVKKKINRYAFSGGRATAEEHRRFGGDTATDVSYRYLEFFMEDDAELAEIGAKYRSGALLSGEMKALAIRCVQDLVSKHQSARAGVTDEMLELFMTPRPILPNKCPPVAASAAIATPTTNQLSSS